MLQHDAYDPRRLKNFPSEVLKLPYTMQQSRDHQVTQKPNGDDVPMSNRYYEMWTVPGSFSLEAMELHFRQFRNDEPFEIRVLAIINNEHEPHRWRYPPRE